MKTFKGASPLNLLGSLWSNRELIWSLAKREFSARYRGSLFGILWALFQPLLMLSVYSFVFAIALRPNRSEQSPSEFVLSMFTGLLVFNFYAEALSKSPSLVWSQANYVKKVIFPIDVLPWVLCLSALMHLLLSFCVWTMFYFAIRGAPPGTWVLFPVVIFPLGLLFLGTSWILSAVGVFFRDISQVMSVFVTILMFMSPIFYPLTAVPEKYRRLLNFNPIGPLIESARSVLINGEFPKAEPIAVVSGFSLFIFFLGFAVFQRSRKGFADVI